MVGEYFPYFAFNWRGVYVVTVMAMPCQGKIQEIRRGGFTNTHTPIFLKPHPNDRQGNIARVKLGQSDVTAQLV